MTTADAAAFSVMVGCGEAYLPAFSLALGFGPVGAGMVASLPVLVGAIVQLVTPYAVARLGTNRGWVVACTVVQAASFLPLMVWAARGQAALWQLLVAASVYWAAGMAGAPAWNSWIGTLVPERMRTPYFAQRGRLGQFGVFLGFVVGGFVLQFGEERGQPLAAFGLLFALACACRLLSTACLWSCREVRPPMREAAIVAGGKPDTAMPARLLATLRRMAARPSGTVVTFLCCFMFGTHFAGPYYGAYMLRELGFSYHAFMLVFGTAFLSKALALPSLGRLASRIGAVRLLFLSALAIAPAALLWLPAAHVGYLVGVQVVAGGCWAAYELAVSLVFFEAVGDRERTGAVTVYNLGLAMATVAGAACGGMLLRSLGEDRQAYAAVFATSCVLRLATLPLLVRLAARGGRGPGGEDKTPAPGEFAVQRPDQPAGIRASWARLSRKERALP